ncbi:MAG: putative DNA-binding domain-containing protein [Pseudomonadota bacterium]
MDFQDYQRAFTARIRDPRRQPRPPGAPARRMKVYEELLINNLEGFLLACFPVCRKILGKRRWDTLVRAFFRDHVSHTPYFRQIPEEFLKYVQDGHLSGDHPPFLPELAHYEWVELELDTSDRDAHLPPHDPDGDLLAGRLLLNPVLRVLAYRWPVHRLSPRYKPAEPPEQPTFTLAFRDREHRVRFSLINPATARLLTLIQETPGLTGLAVLARLESEMGQPAGSLAKHGLALLDDLRSQGALLGCLTDA